MANYRLSDIAQQDIEAILSWTQVQFGDGQRLRYEALLVRAILDVAADPGRAGVQKRPDLHPDALSYHLYFSRTHVQSSVGQVRKPRHFLLCRLLNASDLEIARVLHDSMDLDRNLPWQQ